MTPVWSKQQIPLLFLPAHSVLTRNKNNKITTLRLKQKDKKNHHRKRGVPSSQFGVCATLEC